MNEENNSIMESTKIALFKGKQIRKALQYGEWWFSVIDVVEALTDSSNPNDYWYRMKVRVKNEDGIELSTICRQLKLEASVGHFQWGVKMEEKMSYFPLKLGLLSLMPFAKD